MARARMPVPPVLAVLRFPLTPVQYRGRDVVTTPDGAVVMTCDATDRGRQVDSCAADGRPLGRVLQVRGGHWQLVAPGTRAVLAAAQTRHGVRLVIGAGPETHVKGRTEEWDLRWQQTDLLSARRVPRKVAKRCVDVYVMDPACPPVVVAFVVHVNRWAQAEAATNQIILQQFLTSPPPPAV